MGFPIRFTYEVVATKFRFLLTSGGGGNDLKGACTSIVKSVNLDQQHYKFGATKLFMKQNAIDAIIVASNAKKAKMVIIVQK